jgi:ethanolamine utilization protein EutQ (cupin superfamily)
VKVQKFAFADASFERTPGQEGEFLAGNLVDERHGGPITIGYGRYAPNQTLPETLAVDDVMVVLEGRLSVSTETGTVSAGPGERAASGRPRCWSPCWASGRRRAAEAMRLVERRGARRA